MRLGKAGHEIPDKTGVCKMFGWGAKQNTRALITPTKRQTQRAWRTIFGKVSKGIENYLSERVYVRFEREESDRAVVHLSLFQAWVAPVGPSRHERRGPYPGLRCTFHD